MMQMIGSVIFILFCSYLFLESFPGVRRAVSCYRSAKEKRQLAKAVARYIPPLTGIFLFLSLAGCDDEETLLTLAYALYFGGRLLLMFAAIGIVYMVFWLVRALARRLLYTKEQRKLMKEANVLKGWLSALKESDPAANTDDIELMESRLKEIKDRLAELK